MTQMNADLLQSAGGVPVPSGAKKNLRKSALSADKEISARGTGVRGRLRVFGIYALAALGGIAAVPAAAADLTVTVEGIRNDHGRVYVTLFNSASTWLDGDHSVQDQSIPAHPGPVSVTFHNVAPGRYAAVTFHDENGNTVMDYDVIGLPTEGFAFSNQARPFLSAPSFDRCAFEIGSENAQIL